MHSNQPTAPDGGGRPMRPGDAPGSPPDGERRGTGLASLARDWRVIAGLVLVVAGFSLLHAPAANTAMFLAVNDLGPGEPRLWSDLSVAGLGLSAWIYLAFDAQARADRVARLLWILVVGGLVIHWVKHGFATPRPLAVLGPAGMHVIGEELKTHSMPSGHSAMAFAMLGLMAGEVARDSGARAGAAGATVAGRAGLALVGWTVLAVGIAASRMAVGAHWPADVLAGSGLGLAFAAFSERAWPVAAIARFVDRPSGRRAMALGMIASAGAIAGTPRVLAWIGYTGTRLAHQLDTGYPLAEPVQWVLGVIALVGAVRWWMTASRRPAAPGG
jgi:undecaprenyl-diphosphatase